MGSLLLVSLIWVFLNISVRCMLSEFHLGVVWNFKYSFFIPGFSYLRFFVMCEQGLYDRLELIWVAMWFEVKVAVCISFFCELYRLLSSLLYSSTSRNGNCRFSSNSMVNLIFESLLLRLSRNVFSSLFPCLPITNVSSSYLSQMVSNKQADSTTWRSRSPMNRLASTSDWDEPISDHSVCLYRCSL